MTGMDRAGHVQELVAARGVGDAAGRTETKRAADSDALSPAAASTATATTFTTSLAQIELMRKNGAVKDCDFFNYMIFFLLPML
jgi:hypothetical protein